MQIKLIILFHFHKDLERLPHEIVSGISLALCSICAVLGLLSLAMRLVHTIQRIFDQRLISKHASYVTKEVGGITAWNDAADYIHQ